MRQELAQDRFVARLDDWVGHEVSVRVVTSGDELANFRGKLGERSSEKQPGLFWPISGLGEESSEKPGI